MTDTVNITTNVADGSTISSDLSTGVTITTSVDESTSTSANVITGGIGPQGPTGATGLTGATGPQGPAGTGGIARTISVISTNTNAAAVATTDYVYLVSGTTTLTLPTAVGNTNRYSVTNVDINTVTVATTSAQTINGSSSATLPIPNMSLDFISNGSNWAVE